jgi:hypothetical protein
MLLVMKMMLRVRGFSRTIEWIRRQVETVPPIALVDVAVVRSAERAVAMAGAIYPGRALCLEQSLVLYYMMRRQGIAVRYCQGVRPHPFEAHAWVEYLDEAINDVPEHLKPFARLPGQLP